MLTRREFVQQATLAIGGLRYAAAQEKAEVVVKTPSGPLRGMQAEGVRVFRGVPFAQPLRPSDRAAAGSAAHVASPLAL